ncbi:MAG: hypothetical protein K0Q95_2501 [Bacteroidota bacterium]|jgi:hypothetical protein|nr:hypothetical protein [Bacteroidota bacterium]
MQKYLLILFSVLAFSCYAHENRRAKDSTNIYQKVDTNYVVSFKDLLNVKLFAVVRTNSFTVSDRDSLSSIQYTINTKLNMGIGFTFKGVGFDIEYSPPGLNNDDAKYGKSSQFAVSTSANGRKFIYDVYYRQYNGFRTTAMYNVANDTVFDYSKRADIRNYHAGFTLTYVFNNKRYSSAAPYSLSQKQRKSAGSFLLGTYAFLYGLTADSIIYPDSVFRSFRKELQFSAAASYTFGVSCGYTYTLVFGKKKNWFINIATLPGISYQQFYSVNAFDKSTFTNNTAAFSLQSRLSMGYNRKNYFIGVYWMGNNFVLGDDKQASIQYKYGTFKFYYGHRFDIRKMLKKKL